MPIYQFQHPEYQIVIEEVQKMTDPHVYIDEEGTEWKRVWSVPQASIDTKVDPFSKKRFINKNHDGRTMGDLWDESQDMSRKRAEKNDGIDPVKEKYEQQYSTKRKDKRHRDADRNVS